MLLNLRRSLRQPALAQPTISSSGSVRLRVEALDGTLTAGGSVGADRSSLKRSQPTCESSRTVVASTLCGAPKMVPRMVFVESRLSGSLFRTAAET